MHRSLAVLSACIAMSFAGCLFQGAKNAASWLQKIHPFQTEAATDVIQMDYALVERAVGDPLINEEIWMLADEQIIPFEKKALLAENGFRVGLIGGGTPAALQDLLTTEKSCASRRRVFTRQRNATPLSTGPELACLSFSLVRDGTPVSTKLYRAEIGLETKTEVQGPGVIHLHLTPVVRHGEPQLTPAAAEDRSGWTLSAERPKETYDLLNCDLTLSPNQYLIVGGRLERPDALGCQSFVRLEETAPVQRLLVIRAGAVSGMTRKDSGEGSEPESMNAIMPLAFHASFSAPVSKQTSRGVASSSSD